MAIFSNRTNPIYILPRQFKRSENLQSERRPCNYAGVCPEVYQPDASIILHGIFSKLYTV